MTFSEENYLKTIYHLITLSNAAVSTNAIAEMMETKASSVTDMLKKLAENNNNYEFEFLFVNDGSKDQTLEIIKKYSK